LATDSQSLYAAGKCFECFGLTDQQDLIELALWAQIAIQRNPMAATDPQSLFAQSKCYMCMGISLFQALKLALLAQISLAHNAANDVTPQGLMTQGKCFPCFSNTDTGRIMELALLVQIAS
jgi:hypothetical protein